MSNATTTTVSNTATTVSNTAYNLPCSIPGVQVSPGVVFIPLEHGGCKLLLVQASPIAICVSCEIIFRGYDENLKYKVFHAMYGCVQHMKRHHAADFPAIREMDEWITWADTDSLVMPATLHFVVSDLDVLSGYNVVRCKYCKKCGMGPWSFRNGRGHLDHISGANTCVRKDILNGQAVQWFGARTFRNSGFLIKVASPVAIPSITSNTLQLDDVLDEINRRINESGIGKPCPHAQGSNSDFLTLSRNLGLTCEESGLVVFAKMFNLVGQSDPAVYKNEDVRKALALSCDHMYLPTSQRHPKFALVRDSIEAFFQHAQYIWFEHLHSAFKGVIDKLETDTMGQVFQQYRRISDETIKRYATRITPFLCFYLKEVTPATFGDRIDGVIDHPLTYIPSIIALLLVDPRSSQQLSFSWVDKWMKGAIFFPTTGKPRPANYMSSTCAALLKFFKCGICVLHEDYKWTLEHRWPHTFSLEFMSTIRFLGGFRDIDNGRPKEGQVVINVIEDGIEFTVMEPGVTFQKCLKVLFTTPLFSPTLEKVSSFLGSQLQESLKFFLPLVVLDDVDGNVLMSIIHGHHVCRYSHEDLDLGQEGRIISFESKNTTHLRHHNIRYRVTDWDEYNEKAEELTQLVLTIMDMRPFGSPRAAEYNQLSLLESSETVFIRGQKQSLFTHFGVNKDKNCPGKKVTRFLDSFLSFGLVFLMNVVRPCVPNSLPRTKTHLVPLVCASYVLSVVTDHLTVA